ncbi:MAG: alpha/beta hydrolase [Hyphomicrobiaceae bacterium]
MDYESEYNNRQRVPEYADIAKRWAAASAKARDELEADLDIPYGSDARQRFDLYHPAGKPGVAPLAVYIHGGYWQRGDRSEYAFVARELVQRGVRVAVPSYRLCPTARVGDTVADIRAFLAALWTRTGRRPVVAGHSAGGQLAAAMLATDWTSVDGVPRDLVSAAYAISGVFQLEPLMATSINEALRLDSAEARRESPLLWPPPAAGRTLVAAVGGAESQEFLRQSLDIVAAWSKADVTAECVVVPGANHFTVVDELTRPMSAMVDRLVQLARRS